jgi:hypothetical protein
MKSTLCCHVVRLIVSCTLPDWLQVAAIAQQEVPVHVACLGDSITAGARVDATTESYPATDGQTTSDTELPQLADDTGVPEGFGW